MNYSTNERQLFKSSLNDRVISLPKCSKNLYNLVDMQFLTMTEMINCYWKPIEQSNYIGQKNESISKSKNLHPIFD